MSATVATRRVVETAIAGREIEVAILGNRANLVASPAGEIRVKAEFYSYEAKYLDEKGAVLIIPAKLDADQTRRAQEIARKAFLTIGCEGMARVDLLLDRTSGEFCFNELNTIPGFTRISMYPKLWEASGLSYPRLIERLVDLAIERFNDKQRSQTAIDSRLLEPETTE